MTTTTDDLTLTTSRQIKAPARRLYDAWLDPKIAGRFLTACDGVAATDIAIDPRVGGSFHVVMPTGDGAGILHSGEYLELEPGRKIVFTWNSQHVNPGTVVTITFREADGVTEVVLTHVKFADKAKRDGHLKGWTMILDTYARTVAA